jgi:hypothetical protein
MLGAAAENVEEQEQWRRSAVMGEHETTELGPLLCLL